MTNRLVRPAETAPLVFFRPNPNVFDWHPACRRWSAHAVVRDHKGNSDDSLRVGYLPEDPCCDKLAIALDDKSGSTSPARPCLSDGNYLRTPQWDAVGDTPPGNWESGSVRSNPNRMNVFLVRLSSLNFRRSSVQPEFDLWVSAGRIREMIGVDHRSEPILSTGNDSRGP
jgi:hypothetical protein